jgi:hypothetical protein
MFGRGAKKRCPFRWFGFGACLETGCSMFISVNTKYLGGYGCAFTWIPELLALDFPSD